jgi:hypothetical protein
MRILLLLLLCVACGEARFDAQAELERWFERVELEGRSDAPEFLIVWDQVARGRMVDTVQFALWSDGQAVWRDGDVFDPPRYREFRCTPEELRALRAALDEALAGSVEEGPAYPCSALQHILWRSGGSLRGVVGDWYLGGSYFFPDVAPSNARVMGPARPDWERLGPGRREALHDRVAIEAAVVELVERHPEALATSALRLVVP